MAKHEYTPAFAGAEWRVLKPFVLNVCTQAVGHVRYPEAALLHSVAHHVHWAHFMADSPLRPEKLLRRDVIAYSVSTIPTSRSSSTARH